MFSGRYEMAGCVFDLQSDHEYVHRMCTDYLSSSAPDFSLKIDAEMMERERMRSRAQREREGLPPMEFADDYLESLATYRELSSRLVAYDTLLFHGSVVAVDGRAYLFTAKSGVGKSTHVSLWRKLLGDRAVMVNDDKPLIRMSGDCPIVYGTPWDGKHHLSANVSVPLRAVCLLERSETNHIERIASSDACSFLLSQSFMPSDRRSLLSSLSLIDRLSKQVSLYRLGCNMELAAAELSYGTMSAE